MRVTLFVTTWDATLQKEVLDEAGNVVAVHAVGCPDATRVHEWLKDVVRPLMASFPLTVVLGDEGTESTVYTDFRAAYKVLTARNDV